MNRTDLEEQVYDALGGRVTQFEAKDATKEILELMSDTLGDGGRIEIRGFAAFATKVQKSKRARNPMTGETFIKEAYNVVTFKPGLEMRKRVNAGNNMSATSFKPFNERYKK